MAKKDFAWETEVLIAEVIVSEKEKHEIIHCTLNGQAYVAIVEWKLTNEGWQRKKNRTIKRNVFDAAAKIIDSIEEFGSLDDVTVSTRIEL